VKSGLVAGVAAVAAVAVAAVPAVALHRVAEDAAAEVAEAQPFAPSTASPGPAVGTPLLSTRRMPGVVTGRLTTTSLVAGADVVGRASPPGSCLLVTLDGNPLYVMRPDAPLIPASNQKLVTAAVALDVLGPQHRFTTLAVAPPIEDGTVNGDLTIVGGGDPLLATAPYAAWARSAGREAQEPWTAYETLADRIVAAGVTRIEGAVVGQEGRYDTERRVPTWPSSYRPSLEGGPLSSLLVNDGFASFAPARSAADPAQQAAAVMTALLQERGVTVAGAPRSGQATEGAAEVARLESPPLGEVVGELLTTSDNNTAELLVKELGVARAGTGTTAAGTMVITNTLRRWGVPMEGVVVADGSGLDRTNRVTCRVLETVLARGGAPVQAGLAVAGQTGTLADVLRANPVTGKLRGKTGTLTGVKSLTGLVPAQGHQLRFAYVVNAPNAPAVALSQWERLGTALASYPDRPDLGPFLPKPAVVPAATAPTTVAPPTTAAS
jgi:D-alanyl-D-alanine carboxypeptidase/D-alanyl-D-alanine-endopeptidase (penicillin-binding protein 4)